MMYAEVTTKDGNKGLLVLAETIELVLEECMSWARDNGITADEVSEGQVVDAETKDVVGSIVFDKDTVMCVPAV